MTPTKPPVKRERPRSQPMRLFCVEYEHGGTIYVTTVEALTETLARDKFDFDYPNVKVVRVY